MLCLLDTGVFHNFITRESAKRMEFQLEEFKAPIKVHFTNGVPHPTTLQVKEVPLQLGNWRGKVDLLVSTLGGMDCVLGMEFITQNNVLIKRHNRLVMISSKSRIMQVKAHELPCVGGSTIHFMLGKTWEKKCVGGYGMMCVMRVLDEFEPKEMSQPHFGASVRMRLALPKVGTKSWKSTRPRCMQVKCDTSLESS